LVNFEPGIRQARDHTEQLVPADLDVLDCPAWLLVILPFFRLALLLHEAADYLLVALNQYTALGVVQVRPFLLEIVVEVDTVEHSDNPLLSIVTCDKNGAESTRGRRDLQISKIH
jgi:hypothetical protein